MILFCVHHLEKSKTVFLLHYEIMVNWSSEPWSAKTLQTFASILPFASLHSPFFTENVTADLGGEGEITITQQQRPQPFSESWFCRKICSEKCQEGWWNIFKCCRGKSHPPFTRFVFHRDMQSPLSVSLYIDTRFCVCAHRHGSLRRRRVPIAKI